MMETHTHYAKISLLWGALLWNITWFLQLAVKTSPLEWLTRGMSLCEESYLLAAGWAFTLVPLVLGFLLNSKQIPKWHYASLALLVPLGLFEAYITLFAIGWSCGSTHFG